MLLDAQGNKLGDKLVRNGDSVARLKEQIKNECATKRLKNQDMLENQEMALGNPMSPQLFIEKLRKLPNIVVEPGGIPNAVAVRHFTVDTDKDSDTFGKPIRKYVSGFYTDRILPEYSSILPNAFGLPTREIRGWRTVLLALFHAGAVPLSTLRAVFGDANGQRASLWQEQTQSART